MKVLDLKILVTRHGYVQNDDQLAAHQEDVGRILRNGLAQLRDELDQAGYVMTHTLKDDDR